MKFESQWIHWGPLPLTHFTLSKDSLCLCYLKLQTSYNLLFKI